MRGQALRHDGDIARVRRVQPHSILTSITSGVLKVGGGDPPYPPGSDAYGSYYTITTYKLQQSLMLLIDYDQVILGA